MLTRKRRRMVKVPRDDLEAIARAWRDMATVYYRTMEAQLPDILYVRHKPLFGPAWDNGIQNLRRFNDFVRQYAPSVAAVGGPDVAGDKDTNQS